MMFVAEALTIVELNGTCGATQKFTINQVIKKVGWLRKRTKWKKKKKYEVIRILIIAKFAISSPLHGKVIAWTERKSHSKPPIHSSTTDPPLSYLTLTLVPLVNKPNSSLSISSIQTNQTKSTNYYPISQVWQTKPRI